MNDSKFCIVSPWMERGNMCTYLKDNVVTDRVEFVSSNPYFHRTVFDSSRDSCSVLQGASITYTPSR
jgi:hypothetical protein